MRLAALWAATVAWPRAVGAVPASARVPRPHHRLVKGDVYAIDDCDEPAADSCHAQCVDDEEPHPVRCCSDVALPGWLSWCPGVWQNSEAGGACVELPFAEAEALCAEHGGRLCSEKEVRRRCVRSSGCGFDTRLIWTKDGCGERLSSGGEIFVLSAFSHDDVNQWGLIPHWMRHYATSLRLDPENFLCILHSDSKNVTGLSRMARRFWREYGVSHTFHVTEAYSSRLHWRIKLDILLEHVSDLDWVMQVDADELVFLPHSRLPYATLDNLDTLGHNVVYGLMVDRSTAEGYFDEEVDPDTSPFEQFPLNCALTLMWQESDIRKAVAYRGYLRTTSGNHNTLSVKWNGTCAPWLDSPRLNAHRCRVVRERMEPRFPGLYDRLPYAALGRVPYPVPMEDFASVYHFKWIKGLAEKLARRAKTEEYTEGQYKNTRSDLTFGRKIKPHLLDTFCRTEVGPERALRSREMLHLFFNMIPEHFEDVKKKIGLNEQAEDHYLASRMQWLLAQTLHHEELA